MDSGKASLHLDADNPWPGLLPYDESSQRFFYGRESETAELLRLIQLSPFVTLYGKSGLGKSSLLQAGLFPHLRAARFLPVYLRLDFTEQAVLPPLAQAAARLRQELDAAGADAPPQDEGETLWAYLQRRERPIWTADNYPLTPVLVFDQFEEVFSRGGTPVHVKFMLDCMGDLVGNRLSAELADDKGTSRRLNLQTEQYRVVLSFRSDFLAEVEGWEKDANLPKRESLHLKALSRENATQAVEAAGSAVLEPGVAAQIVDFVVNREGGASAEGMAEVEPVLLSLCCYQLNSRRNGRKIDAALLKNTGTNILQTFYDDALSGLGPDASVFIEDNLIQGGRYRSNYPRDEAIASGALTEAELFTLTQRKLLRVVTRDVPRIELIHDRLVGIVRACRDRRRALEKQRQEREVAEEKARIAREEAEQRARDEREEAEQQARVERARERAEQAERERVKLSHWRNGLAVVVVLLMLASSALFYFVRDARKQTALATAAEKRATASADAAKVNAQHANVLRLSVESHAMLNGALSGPDDRAFQQLLAAWRMEPGVETQGGLFDGLMARQHLRSFKPLVITDTSDMVSVAYSADGRMLATGNEDGSIVLRDGDDPTRVLARASGVHAKLVRGVMFDPEGKRLLSASDDGTLRQWLVDGLKPFGAPGRVEGALYSAAYNRDGSLIVSGGEDGTVRLWDASSGQPSGEPIRLNTGPVYGVAFSPNGHRIAVATGPRRDAPSAAGLASDLILIDVATRREVVSVYAHAQGTLGLAFSRDGRYIVTGGKDNVVRVRDLGADSSSTVRIGGHTGDVQSVAFSPDGHYVASGGEDRTLRLWRANDGAPLALPQGNHAGEVTTVAFSPDGRWLVSGAGDRMLRFWPLDPSWSAGAPMLDSRLTPVRSVALSRDGASLAVASREGRLEIRGWTDSPGRPLADAGETPIGEPAPCPRSQDRQSLRGGYSRKRIDDTENSDAADAIAFSPDGSTLMSGHRDGTLRTWNVSTGEIVGAPVRAAGCSIGSLASSDDGHMLVLGTEREALLLDAGDRRLLRTLPLDHEGAVTALALSSDGRLLAVAGDDATLWLYDTVTPRAKGRKIEGLLAVVRSLAFSSDGAYLVSGNAEGSIRVWDVARGRPVGKPQDAHRGAVVALAFAPDGERFLSSGTSGAIRPWPAPRAWLGQMCGKLTTNLSRKAWEEWVSPDAAYRCQCPGLPVAADNLASAPSKENCSP